jgi:multidrug efflux pump subunit AcrA (membrane-fusion protein)
MTKRGRASWIVYALAALLVGAIVTAVLVVGPASGETASQTRVVAAQRGVVQSTVSGSGNVASWRELDLGFKTSGTVTHIYVKQGQQVGQGQLIATLDPQSAEVTLEQAKANLQSAEASLAREEETDGESSSSSSSSPSADSATRAETAAVKTGPQNSAKQKRSKKKKDASEGSTEGAQQTSGSSKKNEESSASTSTSEISAATREANIASARAAVKSDRLTVENDERSVADTRLTAPQSGTIVSLGGEVGETVSGGGNSRASSESSESSSGSGGSGGLGGGGSDSSSSSSSSSSESSSSSGAFAVLSDLSSMKLVVPLSESEVGSVKRGQPATVTVEALKGAKLAAHVSEVAAMPTSNSGVVSYDVTFTLDQLTAGLKAGMSATAEVVVQQAEGVNVPSSAISGGSVAVVEGGKQVRRAVTTGLAGDSTTIVLNGLKAGERVALPQATSSGSASLLSRLGSRTGSKGSLGSGGLGGGFAGGGFAGSGGPPRITGGGPGG